MAMAVDNRQQSQQLNGLASYDQLRYPAPQFTNPWVNNASGAQPSHLYAGSLASSSALDSQQAQRPTSLSIQSYPLPVTASGLGADLINGPRSSYGSQYAASGSSSYVPTSASGYTMDYATSRSPNAYQQDFSKRSSHPSVNSMDLLDPQLEVQRRNSLIDLSNRLNSTTTQAQRNSFSDAIDASRGMVAMSQSDITPRNIYGTQGSSRSSSDSYGFPSTHSAHSSISSASTYPSYYNGSVAGSEVSDYSSASESVDMNSRTLPRPSTLVGANIPPAPQSMMGQFSSKVSSSSQKKHKCKICDKRFTRPSSLQTHMYSHTGEKPFACEVEGCGRHFSVVSNLRRHRKVHKGEGRDHPSPDDS
jgi:uncharacterized Zn-finger protein